MLDRGTRFAGDDVREIRQRTDGRSLARSCRKPTSSFDLRTHGGAWQNVIPFFSFPPDVRRVIYTNIIESLHMQLRKIIKTRGHFPSDEAATKLLWLALRNITDGKVRSTREWKAAMNQFAVLYGDRFINPKI